MSIMEVPSLPTQDLDMLLLLQTQDYLKDIQFYQETLAKFINSLTRSI